jgi:hypothetical protein
MNFSVSYSTIGVRRNILLYNYFVHILHKRESVRQRSDKEVIFKIYRSASSNYIKMNWAGNY